MRAVPAVLGLLLAASACAGEGEGERAGSANLSAAAPSPAPLPPLDVFIARTAVPETKSSGGGTMAPAALFHGRYLVQGGCLLFEGGGQHYLPVFPAGSAVVVTREALLLGERPIPLGAEVTGGGGAIGRARGYLVAEPPPACRFPLLRLWSVARPVTPPALPGQPPAPPPPERQPPSPDPG
jgi:hypothetical protein